MPPINNVSKKKSKNGVDALLTMHGKALQPGQGLSIRLIKGPNPAQNPDPVDPKAPPEGFPIIAKFPVSVVKPDFNTKQYRLYQQDVPKAVDDSDEEAMEGGEPKKRWKRRGKEVPQRQWILQQEVEFLENMLAKREKPAEGGESGNNSKNKKLSSRYEGSPENNPSQYIVLRVPPNAEPDGRTLEVCPVPANAMVTFAQPDSRKTFSLTQAERVIEDQRNSVQTMHHLHDASAQEPQSIGDLLGRRKKTQDKKPKDSKSRLLQKFGKLDAARNPGELDDGDDVMADVAYRNRKGAGSARKELLDTVGDGLKVSDDGVIGGGNDAEFGGRQRFGNFTAEKKEEDSKAAKGESEGAPAERGADGAAMADDFYQRDVQAEYDEMDYDASELFDDDDVDVGEGEIADPAGFVPEEDDEDDNDEDSEAEEEEVKGAEGLASVAGFKALLAKARGEVPAPGAADAADANGGSAAGKPGNGQANDGNNRKRKAEHDQRQKFLEAIGKERPDKGDSRKRQKTEDGASTPGTAAPAGGVPSAPPPIDPTVDGFQIGPDGLRVLTLAAVRCELWLNGGSLPTKRVMTAFDIKKKATAQRKKLFMEIINELCTVHQDPVNGKMWVLKQHWSHMG